LMNINTPNAGNTMFANTGIAVTMVLSRYNPLINCMSTMEADKEPKANP
jgi:hypothetical protein